jgi:hypothetical protein
MDTVCIPKERSIENGRERERDLPNVIQARDDIQNI